MAIWVKERYVLRYNHWAIHHVILTLKETRTVRRCCRNYIYIIGTASKDRRRLKHPQATQVWGILLFSAREIITATAQLLQHSSLQLTTAHYKLTIIFITLSSGITLSALQYWTKQKYIYNPQLKITFPIMLLGGLFISTLSLQVIVYSVIVKLHSSTYLNVDYTILINQTLRFELWAY